MLPSLYHLPTGYRGDSYGPVIFRFFDGSGGAVMLDGVSGSLEVKGQVGICTNTVMDWYTEDGSMFISGNEVRLNRKTKDQMTVLADTYVYDLQLSSGDVGRTYLKGTFPIIDDV